ncbi:MAG: amino acid permease [Gammaproteobacteria bacterium]
MNGFLIASSRLLFSLGRAGMLPRWFASVSGAYHTPRNAILFVGGISLLGPFVGRSAFVPIISSGSLTFAVTLLMTCLSAVRLRSVAPTLERPYRTGIATLYAGAFVASLLVLLMIVPGSPGQLRLPEFLIVAGWMVFGLVCYGARVSTRDMDASQRRYMMLGE